MQLGPLIRPELVFVDVPGSDKPSVLRALADRLVAASEIRDADELFRRLMEREELGSTALGGGVAIPHCKMRRLDQVIVAVGISARDVRFDLGEGEPVRLFFLVVSPQADPAAHLQSLSAISKWIKADQHVERILELDDSRSIYELLQRETA